MTTTYYASYTAPQGTLADPDHSGTSSTSTDVVELRMGNGTYVPTRLEVLEALKNFRRWIIQSGTDGNGTNLPPAP